MALEGHRTINHENKDLLMLRPWVVSLGMVLALAFAAPPTQAQSALVAGATFAARDTLDPGHEPLSDAQACLEGLVWQSEDFRVQCLTPHEQCGDWRIQFPSPLPSGDATNDVVNVEWYMAKDDALQPVTAPAVVVVHESGSKMAVGRMMAAGLRLHGLHAFMVQLPYYGDRRAGGKKPRGEQLVPVIRQAVADVRRARDAVAALPLVESDNISVQGTSLGGFVTATAASLDHGYDQVFIMLAGGDLYGVIQNGQKDAVKVREELARSGLAGDRLKAVMASIEPTRIAHRLQPETTWIYSGKYDRVVPLANARLLAKVAKLDRSHHIEMLANHYSGVLFVPYVLTHIQQQIATDADR